MIKRSLLFLTITLSLFTALSAQQVSLILTGTSSWTVPAGVTSCTVYLFGAGGGSGGSIHNYALYNSNSGGGGGGACVVSTISGLTSGDTYTTIAGSGGVPGDGNYGYPGGDGGTSSFSGPRGTWSAAGGGGGRGTDGCPGCVGTGGAGGTVGAGTGITVYAGGNGSSGYNSIVGAGGAGAGSSGPGTDAVANACGGADVPGGPGAYPGGAGVYNIYCGSATYAGAVAGYSPGGGAAGVNGYAPNNYPRSNGAAGGDGQVVIIYTPANIWTGAASTDWNDAGNWSVAVPTATTDAFIPGGLSNYPWMLGTGPQVNNITIYPGASITVTANANLTVHSGFTNHGQANVGDGEVAMNDGTVVSGYSSFSTLSIYGTVTMATDAGTHTDIRKRLFKGAGGRLNTAGTITMKSTAAGTAWTEQYAPGAILGNITIEHYIPGVYGHHQISSPVSGAPLSNLHGFSIGGVNGALAVGSAIGTLCEYREASNTTSSLNNSYYNYTSPTNIMTSAKGLTAQLNGASTITFTGAVATGTLTCPITFNGSNATTRGWNLIGNPYPSPMAWSALKAGNAGAMSGTCYLWKPSTISTGVWESYNGTGGTGGVGDIIPVGQGFFVLATGNHTLTFNDNMRFYSDAIVSYKSDVLPGEIRLALTGTTDATDALFYTEEGRSIGFDNDVDALLPPDMSGEATSISYINDGQKYLMNAADAISEDMVLPVSIHTAAAGLYTISASSLNVSGMPVYLYDRIANKYYDLSTETATITAQGSDDNNNFSIVFKKAAATAPGLNIYGRTGSIVIEQAASLNPSTIRVTNILGQEVTTITTTEGRVEIPVQNANNAIYLVSVKQNGISTMKKVMVK